jgi:hypothetical protein
VVWALKIQQVLENNRKHDLPHCTTPNRGLYCDHLRSPFDDQVEENGEKRLTRLSVKWRQDTCWVPTQDSPAADPHAEGNSPR